MYIRYSKYAKGSSKKINKINDNKNTEKKDTQ